MQITLFILVLLSVSFNGCEVKFYDDNLTELSNTPVQLTFDVDVKSNPVWSPDGEWIAYSHQTYLIDFDVFSTDGAPLGTYATINAEYLSESVISPDGNYIIGRTKNQRDLWLFDLTNNTQQILLPDWENCYDPAWGYDNNSIAFTVYENRYTNIFLTDKTGSLPQQISTTDSTSYDMPSWATNNTHVLARRYDRRSERYEICILSIDSASVSTIYSDSLRIYKPVMSNDGSMIAFLTTSNSSIFSINILFGPTREKKCITEFLSHSIPDLWWTPDNDHLLYTIYFSDQCQVRIVNINDLTEQTLVIFSGENLQVLKSGQFVLQKLGNKGKFIEAVRTDVSAPPIRYSQPVNGIFDIEPVWAPQGTRIYFERGEHIYTSTGDANPAEKWLPMPARNLTFSADGNYAIYLSSTGIALRNLLTDSTLIIDDQITTDDYFQVFPAPDKKWLATFNWYGSIYEIKNSTLVFVREFDASTDAISWSPDLLTYGTSLTFDYGGDIYMWSSNTFDFVRLIENASDGHWAPDGESIAFIRDDQVHYQKILFPISE
ncbi:PD40 domain-containing protein [candidate division KSB1 bacterium]|nr:PD40 domain-containing protein [candidate division KSB1 bacterium]